jgi:hypothetical protein
MDDALQREISMKNATDKLVRSQADEATRDSGKVRLGDGAITFQPEAPRKVARDAATADNGKVRLGDGAITFQPETPKKVARDAATADGGKVRFGDFSPTF